MLQALARSGARVDRAFVMWAAPAYPRRRKLWFRSGKSPATLGPATRWLAFLNLPGIKSVTAGLLLFPRLLLWCLSHRRSGAAAVLLYNITHPMGIVSIWAGRLTGVPVIGVIADINVPGSGLVEESLLRRAEFALQKQTLPRLDGIVALTRRMVVDFAPCVPAICVEGAVDDAVPERRMRSDDRDFVLMYSGGLNELKGIPLLLDAFAQLRGDHYRLWITGGGGLEARVRDAAAADDRIEFLGFLPYDQVRQRYADADLLVNPHSTAHASSNYVFPSKLLEFMATETPVLSTVSTPELQEEYGHVLYLVQDANARALAHAIEQVANCSAADRRKRGRAARAWVISQKSWAAQGRRISQFMAEIAAAPRRRAKTSPTKTPAVGSTGAN
jgi:glycosyltransferase involved in cell wall biosynthesis